MEGLCKNRFGFVLNKYLYKIYFEIYIIYTSNIEYKKGLLRFARNDKVGTRNDSCEGLSLREAERRSNLMLVFLYF